MDKNIIEASIKDLEAVLCDLDGNVCIKEGSEGDRAVIQNAINNLRGVL